MPGYRAPVWAARLFCCVCNLEAEPCNYDEGERDIDGNWICAGCLAAEKEQAA